LGLRRPTTVGSANHQNRAFIVWRFPPSHPVFLCLSWSSESSPDRDHRPRVGRKSICANISRFGRPSRARFSRDRQSALDELVRGVDLDSLRVRVNPHHQNRKSETMDLVRASGGIGLENKHSMLIWGAALTAGLLLTRQRQWFRTPWIWIAGLLAFLILLPNLVWNYQHHFPFLELQANIRRSGRNVDLTPLSFFGQEVLSMHPMNTADLAGRALVLSIQ
jgi:hypothetical protein